MALYEIHVVEHIWKRQRHVMFLSVLYVYPRRSCITTCYHDFSSSLSCTAPNRKPTETVKITLESKTKQIFGSFSVFYLVGFIVFYMFVLCTVQALVCYFGICKQYLPCLYIHYIFCVHGLPLNEGEGQNKIGLKSSVIVVHS